MGVATEGEVLALRELLSAAEALEVAAREGGASFEERAPIRAIAGRLREALELALQSRPGSPGARRAARLADEALAWLGDLLGPGEAASVLVATLRARGAAPDETEVA